LIPKKTFPSLDLSTAKIGLETTIPLTEEKIKKIEDSF